MSKSFRKNPCGTLGRSNKSYKRISNKKFRKKTKKLLNQEKFDLTPNTPKEVFDSWGMNDKYTLYGWEDEEICRRK